ncbi:metallophosphoesterase [Neptunicella sp. SCSIO 80796]|uniref:metallophosphoesterase n=1 Tax=Neptunicella plasticusilytica TaxID=3117012 RepID=UPI003A4DDF2B
MKSDNIYAFYIVTLSMIFCCLPLSAVANNKNSAIEDVQIAFMPDIHFHDIYANFADGSFKGIPNSISGKHATIRTLSAELNSTRLFNENYFALLAALDDVVARGIKLVALPGDFSDDGQPVHLRGLAKILQHYSDQYSLEFFAAPGNHDPVRPFDYPGGKADFLGENGYPQRIYSKGAKECTGYQGNWASIDVGYPLNTLCSEEIRHAGYQSIMSLLGRFGFYPQQSYLYWETPYSSNRTERYDFRQAQKDADFSNRQYEICYQGSGGQYKQAHFSECTQVPDSSYLVEPVPGLWLLAIDANVYIPQQQAANNNAPARFSGSGNAGYNKMLSHKIHVIEWVKEVAERAKHLGKTLIAFSHFPMSEFYDGQSDNIAALFGAEHFQLARRPQDSISHILADTGIKVHVGGHMHINDTGVTRNPNGHFLFNIQAPSIAAYVPAYKLMTLKADNRIEVQTVVLDKVPRYNELFEHYRQEYQVLKQSDPAHLWNKDILNAKSYREFTRWHITELTRQRFLPQEWPAELRELLFALSAKDMLVLSQMESPVTLQQWPSAKVRLQHIRQTEQWQTGLAKAEQLLLDRQFSLQDLASWNGFDLAVDFYRLRNAGGLALSDIGQQRLEQYRFLTLLLAQLQSVSVLSAAENPADQQSLSRIIIQRFAPLFQILDGFKQGLPDTHFMLDLQVGKIKSLD